MRAGSLLAWRLRLALASQRGRGQARRITLLLLGSGAALPFFFGAWAWFRAALSSDWARLAPLAVAGALHGTFLFSLLRDTGAALGHLFVSQEMPLLLATPVRPRSLLFWKGLEAVGDAIAFPVTLVLPLLYGYGAATGAPIAYYVAAPIGVLLLLGFTVSLGFLISLILAPIVPVGRVRQWIRAASGVAYLVIWIGLGWLSAGNGKTLGRIVDEGRLPASLSGHAPAWPSTWISQVLVDLAHGAWPLAPLAKLGLLSFLLFGAVLVVARLYPRAWQRAQELNRQVRRYGRRRKESAGLARPAPTASGSRISRGPAAGLVLAGAFVRRDRKLIGRDAALLWDIGLLVVMSSILPLLAAPMLARKLEWIVFPSLVFFSTELGYDLGSRAFPLERRALPWVLNAPLSPAAICAARAATAWWMGTWLLVPATLAVSWLLHFPVHEMASALVLALGLFTTVLPIGLTVGIYLGRSDWVHPRQMLNLGGRLVLSGILVVLSVGLAISLSKSSEAPAPRMPSPADWLGAGGFVAALMAMALWASVERLRRWEWTG